MELVSKIFMIIGALFFTLGGLGILRMPDTFNRIQAGTKASTLGAFSLVLGVGLYQTDWLPKAILIIIFIAISNPVGSSVLAKAAYKANPKPNNLISDELADLYETRGDSHVA